MGIIIEKEFELLKEKILNKITSYVEEYRLDTNSSSIENLAIHLALSISRQYSGNYIYYSESQLIQCKDLNTYPIAKILLEDLAQEFEIEASQIDIYYTSMYLANLSLLDLDFQSSFDLVDEDIETIMNETLDEIQKKLGYNLKQKTNFYKGITLHFYPAIERLKANKQLDSNPLVENETLSEDKEYQCALILNNIVEKHYHKRFNIHELGYITLHFGTAFYQK